MDTIKILREYNKWRRGLPPYDVIGVGQSYTNTELGLAIEDAISKLEEYKQIVPIVKSQSLKLEAIENLLRKL